MTQIIRTCVHPHPSQLLALSCDHCHVFRITGHVQELLYTVLRALLEYRDMKVTITIEPAWEPKKGGG